MRIARLSPVFCVLLAAGATLAVEPPAPTTPFPPALVGSKVCCADPSEFRYTALPATGTVHFDISKQSPVFEFQLGLSRFEAFSLPPLTAPYVLEIRSFITGGPNPQRARVLYPVAAVLTDDYLVARAATLDQLKPELPITEEATGPAYRLSIPFQPGVGRERYLVVFTPAPLIAGHTLPPFRDPESATQVAREAFLGASAVGHLSITVRAPAGNESLAPDIFTR